MNTYEDISPEYLKSQGFADRSVKSRTFVIPDRLFDDCFDIEYLVATLKDVDTLTITKFEVSGTTIEPIVLLQATVYDTHMFATFINTVLENWEIETRISDRTPTDN